MAFGEILSYYDTRKLENTDSFQYLHHKLTEDKWYKPLLDYSEEIFKWNRVYTVTGFGSILLASLFYQYGLHLIVGAVGFLYPGYRTVECLENFDVNEGKKWLTYWLVVSAFNFLEIILFFLNWLPGFWFLKCLFYMWCYGPFELNGSYIIYTALICPFFEKNQTIITEALGRLKKTAHTICSDPSLDNVTDAVVEKTHIG